MEQLSFLPEEKQQDIAAILDIIKQEANPQKVILFGSHAKDTWVEHRFETKGMHQSYISDYDFLVVIKKDKEREETIASHIENRCKYFKNPVSPLVHDIDYINEGLRISQYFFSEIIQEGILLYDTERFAFAEPKLLTPEERRFRSRMYYNNWFPRGDDFLDNATYSFGKGKLSMATFLLHQAAECLYNTVLLVYYNYKPKTHNLQVLRNYSKNISLDLRLIFYPSKADKRNAHLFNLLKKGYIDARYSDDFVITEGDLQELVEKVSLLKEVVKGLCQERI